MAHFDFDFSASPRRPRMLGIALLLAGLAAVIAVGLAWQQARATVAGQALQIAAIQQTTSAGPRTPATREENATLMSQTEIAAQLAYAWQPAFEALAAARSGSIALVSLDAVQAKSQIKLVAEARRLADAVAFIEVLQQQAGVRRAELVQHELQTDNPQKPIRFNVLVELHHGGSTP